MHSLAGRLTAAPAHLVGTAAGALATSSRPVEGVRRLDGSADARRLSALERIDYQDAFELDPGTATEGRTAEDWMREILEGAPDPLKRRLVRGWTALGLRLGSAGDPARVLGWRVRADTSRAVLSAPSRIGMPAELVLLRGRSALIFSTQIRIGNPAVAALWAAVEPAHLRIVPDILAMTRRRLAPAP